MLINVLDKATNDDITSNGLHLAEELTKELSSNCFLYFSSGDKYARDANKSYSDLMRDLKTAISRNDPQILMQAQETINLLISASQYWQSLSDVGSEANGTLSTYCEMLMTLGELGRNGVVDLCLATSRNFKVSRVEDNILNANRKKIGDGDVSLNLDRNIYHLGRVLDAEDLKAGCTACFNVLLDQIMSLKAVNTKDNEFFMIQMIDRALNGRSIKEDHTQMTLFQQLLCDKLIVQDREFLFTLKYNFVEEYLAQQVHKSIDELQNYVNTSINFTITNIHTQDYINITDSILRSVDDLNQYYKKNNLYIQAANNWKEFGCIDNLCDIDHRINFFTNALNCANEAVHQNINEMINYRGRKMAVADFIHDVRSKIEEANFQKDVQELFREDIYSREDAIRLSGDAMAQQNLVKLKEVAKDFKFQMRTRDVVFKKAFDYKIFEICILMLRSDEFDKNYHDRIWRSYIYR
jgi:hypothetical protein